MTDTLKRQLSAAAANRHRALMRVHSARPHSEEQREADRDFIICDRAFNDARRAYEFFENSCKSEAAQ